MTSRICSTQRLIARDAAALRPLRSSLWSGDAYPKHHRGVRRTCPICTGSPKRSASSSATFTERFGLHASSRQRPVGSPGSCHRRRRAAGDRRAVPRRGLLASTPSTERRSNRRLWSSVLSRAVVAPTVPGVGSAALSDSPAPGHVERYLDGCSAHPAEARAPGSAGDSRSQPLVLSDHLIVSTSTDALTGSTVDALVAARWSGSIVAATGRGRRMPRAGCSTSTLKALKQ